MRLLALDMATTTGWAFAHNDLHLYGTIDCSSETSLAAKFHRFRKELRRVMHKVNPKHVWYERALGGKSGAALDVARGLQAVLLIECYERSIGSTRVAPNTLKKWATGHGLAGKEQMWNAAMELLERWEHPSKDLGEPNFDEADALCLLAYGLEHSG
jgi:Holliday junction resolvasome RuvABC endonuclease subunit